MKTHKARFIERQVKHIRLVQDYGIFLELNKNKLPFKINDFEILNKLFHHDLDKLKEGKVREGYLALSKYHHNRENNILNKVKEQDLEFGCILHYETQDHHMEYHLKNCTEPNNPIVCEICCDLLAVSNRHGGDVKEAVEYFLENFHDEFSRRNKDIFLAVFELLRVAEKENYKEKYYK